MPSMPNVRRRPLFPPEYDCDDRQEEGSPVPIPPPTLILKESKSVYSSATDTNGSYDITPPPECDVVEIIFGQNTGQAEPATWQAEVKIGTDTIFAHVQYGSRGASNPIRFSANMVRNGCKLAFSIAGTVGGSAIVNFYQYKYAI